MAKFGLRRFGEGPGRDICISEELSSVLLTIDNQPLIALDDWGHIDYTQAEQIAKSAIASDAIPCDESIAFYVIEVGKLYEIVGEGEPSEWIEGSKVIAIVDYNYEKPRLIVAHMLFE